MTRRSTRPMVIWARRPSRRRHPVVARERWATLWIAAMSGLLLEVVGPTELLGAKRLAGLDVSGEQMPGDVLPALILLEDRRQKVGGTACLARREDVLGEGVGDIPPPLG